MPLPMTTTLAMEWSYSVGVSAPASPGSGVSAIVTGPDCRRAQQAMRVLSANPRRRRVLRSSSSGALRWSMPSSTAMGSAPHTPMRQPASMAWPLRSHTSSKLKPASAPTSLASGSKRTVTRSAAGASDSPCSALAPLALSLMGTGAAMPASTSYFFSTTRVRTSQSSASANTTNRMGQRIHVMSVPVIVFSDSCTTGLPYQ